MEGTRQEGTTQGDEDTEEDGGVASVVEPSLTTTRNYTATFQSSQLFHLSVRGE